MESEVQRTVTFLNSSFGFWSTGSHHQPPPETRHCEARHEPWQSSVILDHSKFETSGHLDLLRLRSATIAWWPGRFHNLLTNQIRVTPRSLRIKKQRQLHLPHNWWTKQIYSDFSKASIFRRWTAFFVSKGKGAALEKFIAFIFL